MIILHDEENHLVILYDFAVQEIFLKFEYLLEEDARLIIDLLLPIFS